MDVWEKSLREDHQNTSRRENPSFSSTLLDAIYRSIDESNVKGDDHRHRDQEELILYKGKTARKKHSGNIEEEKEEMKSMRRACMIERWIEKKTSCEKVVVRRKSMADFDRNVLPRNELLMNSSSSSSDSSCGGGFSSSESDSFYVAKKERSVSNSTSCYSMQRPKPIRTSISTGRPERYEKVFHQTHSENSLLHQRNNVTSTQKPKHHENGFVKTKSKAMKIYSDLKKVKQPISPGGRLASFLNSLFTVRNAKKAKISSSNVHESISSTTCSSASSFSRSCLSNTPSSRGKLSNNNGMKRSVRFYPVSVIVDEYSRPCGHKNLHENDHVMSENRRVAEAARELLKSYQKKKEEFDQDHAMITDICDVNGRSDVDYEEDNNDDDDAASYASSDLFELDSIGMERYREELPVYETTHLDTNRAIASGLIL